MVTRSRSDERKRWNKNPIKIGAGLPYIKVILVEIMTEVMATGVVASVLIATLPLVPKNMMSGYGIHMQMLPWQSLVQIRSTTSVL